MSRKNTKIFPDVSDTEPTISLPNIVTENKVSHPKKSVSKKNLPNIEKNPVEYNIITRSIAKKEKTNYINFELGKNNYYTRFSLFDIDFDDSSRAWMRNKRKNGNGEYSYIM